jgi:magnesium-transporting ATPase (P-type)
MTNEKWMSLSIAEIEKKLNTSAASGLSRKAARARFQKAGENAFFLLPTTSAYDSIRTVLTQPSMILLLLLSLLLMIFQQSAQGRLLLGLTLAYTTVLILMRLWTEHIYRIPARASRPLVKVIREGQLYLLDSSRLVPGDLIELEAGDIAPCDLRLVCVQGMRVATYLGRDQFVQSIKSCNENGIPYVTDIGDHSNMVYGGSTIEQGFARALAVETGKHTYIGALQGGYPIIVEQKLPGNAEKMRKIASHLQIILLLSVLPIMCLCLLVQKTEAELPLLFSSLLCLCLANLTGHMDTLLNFGMAVGVRRAMNNKQSNNLALIKTDKSPDRITNIDYLFLLGTHALSEQSLPLSEAGNSLITKNGENTRQQNLRFALGEHFLCTREKDIAMLRDAGIQPILVIPEETRDVINYIMRTGIVENASEIAYASRFRPQKLPITADFGKYRAYCGFSNDELKSLMIFLQKAEKSVAIFGNASQNVSLMKFANVRLVGVDDLNRFISPITANEKKPELRRPDEGMTSTRMRQDADILIPYASKRNGGLSSILRALCLTSDITRNMILMTRYLIFTQLIRILLIVPTTLLGVHLIQPIQTAFSGLWIDLIFSCALLLRTGRHNPEDIREIPRDTRKRTVVEAFCTAALTLLCFWGIYANSPNISAASSALYETILTVQITFFLICWNPITGIKKAANRLHLIMILILTMIVSGLLVIFGAWPHLGIVLLTAPYGYLPLIGLISTILVSLVVHLYRSALSR